MSDHNQNSRALDASIAREIFKWEVTLHKGEPVTKAGTATVTGAEVPRYSTAIPDMWLVIEKMRDSGFDFNMEIVGITVAARFTELKGDVTLRDSGTIRGQYTEETVCRAALKAMTGKDPID